MIAWAVTQEPPQPCARRLAPISRHGVGMFMGALDIQIVETSLKAID